jgi:hypothetical protein
MVLVGIACSHSECPANAYFCDGGTLVGCVDVAADSESAPPDFRWKPVMSCGSADLCKTVSPNIAVCSVDDTYLSSCASGQPQTICRGNVLARCGYGYTYWTIACGGCDESRLANPATWVSQCTGYLGGLCQVDADCAPGLTCHDFSGGSYCSAQCGPGAPPTAYDPCNPPTGEIVTQQGPETYYGFDGISAYHWTGSCVSGWCIGDAGVAPW